MVSIFNYGSEVWGFYKGNAIEHIHMQFCKRLLGVRKGTQNDFVYGKQLSRCPMRNYRMYFTNILQILFQSYLYTIKIARFRICLTRLRMSSHRLYIETGSAKV